VAGATERGEGRGDEEEEWVGVCVGARGDAQRTLLREVAGMATKLVLARLPDDIT